MKPDIVVIAQELDDIDISGWRERVTETAEVIRRSAADLVVEAEDGGRTVEWTTPRRTVVVGVHPDLGITVRSERQAFRAAFTLQEHPRSDVPPIDPSDRDQVLAALARMERTLEDTIPDEGSEADPSDTWDVLKDGMLRLSADLLNFIATSFEKSKNEDGIEMIREASISMSTGAPFGPTMLSARIDGEDIPLLTEGGQRLIATMIAPTIRVSCPDKRTLLMGPAVVRRGPWRDPGPVERLRSVNRFMPRPPSDPPAG